MSICIEIYLARNLFPLEVVQKMQIYVVNFVHYGKPRLFNTDENFRDNVFFETYASYMSSSSYKCRYKIRAFDTSVTLYIEYETESLAGLIKSEKLWFFKHTVKILLKLTKYIYQSCTKVVQVVQKMQIYVVNFVHYGKPRLFNSFFSKHMLRTCLQVPINADIKLEPLIQA